MRFADILERNGFVWRNAAWIPSLLYEAAVEARGESYRKGWVETVRMPVPVFCVGNMTVGGSGKTPGVHWLAEYLLSKGRRPAILTRGYGRRDEDELLVVSDGKAILADARAAGDEPVLLARRLPSVPVVAAADRASAARKAMEDFAADCLVLDDGFQHIRLFRNLDLVCVDASSPHSFGLGSRGLRRALLPAGALREPLSGLARAGLIFLTKINHVDFHEAAVLREQLSELAPGVPQIPVRYGMTFADPASGRDVSPEELKGLRVLTVCGLARPKTFEDAVKEAGADVLPMRFADHHFFTEAEMSRIVDAAAKDRRRIIVTEKDFQRLPEGFPCWVARLRWLPDTTDPTWLKKIDSLIS